MIVVETGRYKVLHDFNVRTPITSSYVKKGDIITIKQVDIKGSKVIGPELLDWISNDLPVIKIE